MLTVKHSEYRSASKYIMEVLCDWFDPIPPIDISGAGRVLYDLLRTETSIEGLPLLEEEGLENLEELVVSSIEDGSFTPNVIFTYLEDEQIIEIVLW